MPTSALAYVQADFVVPLKEIAGRLRLSDPPGVEEMTTTDEEVVAETDLEAGFDIAELHDAPGDLTNGHTEIERPPASAAAGEPSFDVVAIAASAGGLPALTSLLSRLPSDFAAPILVVQHLDRRHRSRLAEILDRRTPLDVCEAEHGQTIVRGSVYVAPPDRHMLVTAAGTISLTQSELVHFVRPSADLLFESVAAAYGERAIAVVLTGSGVDGATGVNAIKKMGGTVVAQDEASSAFFAMPSAAIETGTVDFVLSLDELPAALTDLVVTS